MSSRERRGRAGEEPAGGGRPREGDGLRMKWRGLILFQLKRYHIYDFSWLFSFLQGNRTLMNENDFRFTALGVTAPDEAIPHPIPPVRVEGEGPHLRLLVDVGAHSKIGQQLEKGLVSSIPLGVHRFVDVV